MTSYRLGDLLLFAPETYVRLFELHHRAVFPAQLVALTAVVLLVVLIRRGDRSDVRVVFGILALVWAWVAISFHLYRYADINWAARWFAWAFIAQAVLLAIAATAPTPPAPARVHGVARLAGIGLFAFAVLAHPLLQMAIGRSWNEVELFAVTPDPTAVGTLGLLLLTSGWRRWVSLPVPLMWCAVSALTLWTMGSTEWAALAAAALAALTALFAAAVMGRSAG